MSKCIPRIAGMEDLEDIPAVNPKLDSFQIGGTHYTKHEIQPFHIIDEYGLDFYEGNCLKYLLRCRDKGGLEDLKKARHYLEIIIAKKELSQNAK